MASSPIAAKAASSTIPTPQANTLNTLGSIAKVVGVALLLFGMVELTMNAPHILSSITGTSVDLPTVQYFGYVIGAVLDVIFIGALYKLYKTHVKEKQKAASKSSSSTPQYFWQLPDGQQVPLKQLSLIKWELSLPSGRIVTLRKYSSGSSTRWYLEGGPMGYQRIDPSTERFEEKLDTPSVSPSPAKEEPREPSPMHLPDWYIHHLGVAFSYAKPDGTIDTLVNHDVHLPQLKGIKAIKEANIRHASKARQQIRLPVETSSRDE